MGLVCVRPLQTLAKEAAAIAYSRRWSRMDNYAKLNLILLISCQAEIRVHELFSCERA